MQKIFENWNSFIKEGIGEYEINVLLRYETDASVYGDIMDKIRAIPGITIVKTSEKTKRLSKTAKASVLNIRFLLQNIAMPDYATFLKTKLASIKDNEGDRILGVSFTTFPKKVD